MFDQYNLFKYGKILTQSQKKYNSTKSTKSTKTPLTARVNYNQEVKNYKNGKELIQ
jgi:hypothetical protein